MQVAVEALAEGEVVSIRFREGKQADVGRAAVTCSEKK
jgi:hypothetical protein